MVSGLNFGGNPVVLFNNVPLAGCVPDLLPLPTALTCTSPPGDGLGHIITLSAGNQTVNHTQPWNYDAPFIQTVSPSSAPTQGFSPLAMTGTSLGTGAVPSTYDVYFRDCSVAYQAAATDSAVVRTAQWTVVGSGSTATISDAGTNKGLASITITPPGLFAALYDVQLRWPNNGGSAAPNVPVSIVTATGSVPISLNQRVNAGDWVSMGQFVLGAAPSVTLSNTGTSPSSLVTLDSIRFCRRVRSFSDA